MRQRIRRFKLFTENTNRLDSGLLNYESFNNVWQISVYHFINEPDNIKPYAGTVLNRITGEMNWWYQDINGSIVIHSRQRIMNVAQYVRHAIRRVVNIGHTHIRRKDRKRLPLFSYRRALMAE